jgi:6-phosphofructokinase
MVVSTNIVNSTLSRYNSLLISDHGIIVVVAELDHIQRVCNSSAQDRMLVIPLGVFATTTIIEAKSGISRVLVGY